MCETTKEIKFCTCNATELLKPDWKLTTTSQFSSRVNFIMGSYMTSDKELSDDKLRKQILKKLNKNTLFDIKGYQPQENDVLEVFHLVIYRYLNKKWIEESTYHPFGNYIYVNKNENSEVFVGKIEEK